MNFVWQLCRICLGKHKPGWPPSFAENTNFVEDVKNLFSVKFCRILWSFVEFCSAVAEEKSKMWRVNDGRHIITIVHSSYWLRCIENCNCDIPPQMFQTTSVCHDLDPRSYLKGQDHSAYITKFRVQAITPYCTVESRHLTKLFNANNVAERLRKMSIRFSIVIHTYNVLSHAWD